MRFFFYYLTPLISASRINQKILFFQSRSLDLLFLISSKICFKNGRYWDPHQNPMESKTASKSTKWHWKVENIRWSLGFVQVFFQTMFSRNHTNPRAVGTSWLSKGHFFDVHWLNLCFRCVSLWFVLYHLFNIFFPKTSVNAQPLRHPFFEKIAAH